MNRYGGKSDGNKTLGNGGDSMFFTGVVIRQADLDTIVTGWLCKADTVGSARVTQASATGAELADVRTLCLECGGSGQVERNNFDHHGSGRQLPPACVQAMNRLRVEDVWARDLVDYAGAVDLGLPAARQVASRNLSALISGVRLVHADEGDAFFAGIRVLHQLAAARLDPRGPLPEHPQWRPYWQAKDSQRKRLVTAAERVELFELPTGFRWGFLASTVPGVHGVLFAKGCQVSIAASRHATRPGRYKYSIASTGLLLVGLCALLNRREPGWGGPDHGTIIGSPFVGSELAPDVVKAMVGQWVREAATEGQDVGS